MFGILLYINFVNIKELLKNVWKGFQNYVEKKDVSKENSFIVFIFY